MFPSKESLIILAAALAACAPQTATDSRVAGVENVQSIVQNADGTFSAQCTDGSYETTDADAVRENRICEATGGVKPRDERVCQDDTRLTYDHSLLQELLGHGEEADLILKDERQTDAYAQINMVFPDDAARDRLFALIRDGRINQVCAKIDIHYHTIDSAGLFAQVPASSTRDGSFGMDGAAVDCGPNLAEIDLIGLSAATRGVNFRASPRRLILDYYPESGLFKSKTTYRFRSDAWRAQVSHALTALAATDNSLTACGHNAGYLAHLTSDGIFVSAYVPPSVTMQRAAFLPRD